MIAGRLQEKNGYFYVVLSYKDGDGKRKEPWISTGLTVKGNKRQAQKLLEEYRLNFDTITGKLKTMKQQSVSEQNSQRKFKKAFVKMEAFEYSQGILFGDYLLQWVEKMKDLIEPVSYDSYKKTIKTIIAPYFDDRKIYLETLTAKDISAFYDEQLKRVKPNTGKHYHAYIREALQFAYKDGLVASNEADKVRLPKIEPYIGDYYNSEELKELFRIVRGTKIEFPVIMASYYGLRRSEIVGLKWSAIDFNYKTLQIRHTVTNSVKDGKYILIKKNRTKTQKSLRTLPLFENVELMLLQMKEKQERNKELFGNSYDYADSDYIYVHENGKLIDPGYITQHFAIVLRNNKLRKIRFHDLRHSCATLLRHNGARMEDIQRWLGHSTIGTTEKIYAHFEEEEHLISAERIAKALQANPNNSGTRLLPNPKRNSDFEM